MKIKFQKIMNIASELLAYCQNHGATEFHLNIKEVPGAVTLSIKAVSETITKDELEFLEAALSTPRQREVEQAFWELIGETDNNPELQLVGMLCDEAIINYDDLGTLTIELKRLD